MARLRRDSSESFNGGDVASTRRTKQPDASARRSPRKKTTQPLRNLDLEDTSSSTLQLTPKEVAGQSQRTKQIRLAPLRSLQDAPLPLQLESPKRSRRNAPTILSRTGQHPQTQHPQTQHPQTQHPQTQHPQTTQLFGLEPKLPEDSVPTISSEHVDLDVEVAETDVEESIWCGSDASSEDCEEDLPSPRKFLKFRPKLAAEQSLAGASVPDLSRQLGQMHIDVQKNIPVSKLVLPSSDTSRPTSSSDKENNDRAILRFSPPRLLHSPRKLQSPERPVTPPPQSPSKGRLQSPSKKQARVPTPPLRPSLDAFWNPETVNNWNDQYSPRKEWSPRKLKQASDDGSTSPTTSPRKPQSPTKRTKVEIAAKKDWEARKHQVAVDFLAELDSTITDNRLRELASSTGGVRFIWSKTLNTTAGRANWRRETTKTRDAEGTTVAVVHKHHASIELAEKVIDDENRLLNVVAHEFCHLANFMVSGIKDQPHGKQFKDWGRRCTKAFADRGVEVTTKHSYQIEYKYIWRCSNEDCAVEFKRHSKSIDPKRHTCGTCRSKLEQIKPVPRNAGSGKSGPTGYAAYVKQHYADVKAGLSNGATQKEVMEAVARRYRAEKASLGAGKPTSSSDVEDSQAKAGEMDRVARQLEFIVIED